MQIWLLLIMFELVPIILWSLGWYFENKFSEYPDTTRGLRTKESKINKSLWIYGNKVAGKVFGATGTLLFFIIAVGFIVLGTNPVLMAFIVFIIICVAYIIVDGLIKKKYKSQK